MKKVMIWLAIQTLLLSATAVQADPIQDNSQNDYKAGWFLNHYDRRGALTCPQTCKIRTKGFAEQEKNMMANTNKNTHVCKYSSQRPTRFPVRPSNFIYGNQYDESPVCHVMDKRGRLLKSKNFYCLCIAKTQPTCREPDLVVTKINKPQWDGANHRSIITAEIRNVGFSDAAQSIARVIDPSTIQATGAPQNAIANTSALAVGASTTVKFYLPYWVYNPNAELEVTADYKGMVNECNENNNTKVFNDQG